ncbi:hypothetical protein [Longirhabdus pacifica]|uniref:hypothetical protein n=1 Tax=Longirhabdus pacifica TaxID=2305227 RepID=UPI0010091790|nr:hypothetical protein [Longirhabdus pacifica]
MKRIMTLFVLLIFIVSFHSSIAIGDLQEMNDKDSVDSWTFTVLSNSSVLGDASTASNQETYKTIVASNQETNWQDVLDGINKFHSAIDKNTLDFDLNKAISIVNNDPKLQLTTTLNARPIGAPWALPDPFDTLTQYVNDQLQMNLSNAEFQTLKQEIQGSGVLNNYYYKLLFAIDINGNIELIPLKFLLRCMCPDETNFPQFLLYVQGLKAVYSP